RSEATNACSGGRIATVTRPEDDPEYIRRSGAGASTSGRSHSGHASRSSGYSILQVWHHGTAAAFLPAGFYPRHQGRPDATAPPPQQEHRDLDELFRGSEHVAGDPADLPERGHADHARRRHGERYGDDAPHTEQRGRQTRPDDARDGGLPARDTGRVTRAEPV